MLFQVPRQTPRQQCESVPKEDCQSVPRQQCNTVPRQQCSQVPRQECNTIPRQQETQACTNIPRQQCDNVPQQQCRTVPKYESKSQHKMFLLLNDFVAISEKLVKTPFVNLSTGVNNAQVDLPNQLMEAPVPLHCHLMEVLVDQVLSLSTLEALALDQFKVAIHSQAILFQQEIVILSLTLPPLILMDHLLPPP